LAILIAILRASSFVSSLAAELKKAECRGARWLGASFQLIRSNLVNPADYETERERD
jgi:hypothetical protein